MLLVSFIETPWKLVPERLQKIIFVEPDEVDLKFFFADSQLYFFGYYDAPTVEGTNKRIRAAFHFKGNDVVIGYHNRAYVQIMRRNGRDHKTPAFRENDRPIAA